MLMLKDIIVAENDVLEHVGAPNEQLRFVLKNGAHLKYFLAVLNQDSSKTHVVIELQGDYSRVDSKVIFFGNKKQEQNLRLEHIHCGRGTVSTLVAQGAVKDQALSQFYGLIKMLSGSIGAEGSLHEHSLLLSPGARIETVPALEIEHDEVQASHAATLEKADAEKLFYLLSRGLNEKAAIELLVEGFFNSALELLPPKQRALYYSAIMAKL